GFQRWTRWCRFRRLCKGRCHGSKTGSSCFPSSSIAAASVVMRRPVSPTRGERGGRSWKKREIDGGQYAARSTWCRRSSAWPVRVWWALVGSALVNRYGMRRWLQADNSISVLEKCEMDDGAGRQKAATKAAESAVHIWT